MVKTRPFSGRVPKAPSRRIVAVIVGSASRPRRERCDEERFFDSGAARSLLVLGVALALGATATQSARAEPYIAARARLRCSTCHVNATGGGERTAQGRVYAMGTLARSPFDASESMPLLSGELGGLLTLGADLRASNVTVRPRARGEKTTNEFRTEEANLYLTVPLWKKRLALHVDERVAPGGAQNREAFLIYTGLPGEGWIKAGRFFPPFGTRLYDDAAFIRSATGYSFQTTDEGIEIGFEPGRYSFIGSVTNGAGGGAENDASKEISLVVARLFGAWRLATSASNNITGGQRTTIVGLSASAGWKDFTVVAEGDVRDDVDGGGLRRQWIGYIEGTWEIAKGWNLRASHEYLDPNRHVPTDAQTRTGLGLAWFPVSGLEIDARLLRMDGPPQTPGSRSLAFAGGAHLFF